MNPHSHIQELQARFKTATQDNILALQREYNKALDDFRNWARHDHSPAPAPDANAPVAPPVVSQLVIHHIVWVGKNKIAFVD